MPIVPLHHGETLAPFIKAHLAQALMFAFAVWVVIAILPRGLIRRIVG